MQIARIASITAAVTAVMACAGSARADSITLKSGKTYTGKIYKETATEVSVVSETPAGIISIPVPRTDIGSMEKNGEHDHLLLMFSRFVTAYNEGDRHFNGGSYYKAIDFYKKAVELNPRVYATYFNLGQAYAKLGLFNEARTNLEKAIAIARQLNEQGTNEKDFIARAEERLTAWAE